MNSALRQKQRCDIPLGARHNLILFARPGGGLYICMHYSRGGRAGYKAAARSEQAPPATCLFRPLVPSTLYDRVYTPRPRAHAREPAALGHCMLHGLHGDLLAATRSVAPRGSETWEGAQAASPIKRLYLTDWGPRFASTSVGVAAISSPPTASSIYTLGSVEARRGADVGP